MRSLRLSLASGVLAAATATCQNITTTELIPDASCTTPISSQNITIADLSSGASCACAHLTSKYGNLVLAPNSTQYTAEATDFWDVRSDLLPRCIFLPAKADQVAEAVSTFVSCGAQFAIRGGGHMNVGNAGTRDINEESASD
jgi:hypothetical protein